jgi:hypothetical protein
MLKTCGCATWQGAASGGDSAHITLVPLKRALQLTADAVQVYMYTIEVVDSKCWWAIAHHVATISCCSGAVHIKMHSVLFNTPPH